ncbi:MAG: hypothetical protein A2857_04150 [Candidatus Levybacteria bacterium RIFCSPHIGHO2_01_FULL_36_15]|nr:MAG: hypothetical protein A2857_04150 [Candidatus Levybacteria bacterium RIFCSPHIGHO2_01_FULL_36_15]OGH37424.1 MAG: hypothetical protein A2905_04800 [Candidatus Levybacteria bacterium RIFCSPLOWO2_01_FULL_36_10]
MSKEIYLAGKVDSGKSQISQLSSELESRGHHITLKWWEGEKLPKPYLDYPRISAEASRAMIVAIVRSHVFIFIPQGNVLGALVEFGVALRDREDHPDKEVIVITSPETRQSVFYGNEGVIVLKNTEQLKERPWY